MPTPTEYLKHTSVIIITGGSSGIGCSIIKAIKNLAPTATVCNLSRSKPGDFFDQHGIHIATDLSDPTAVAAAAEQLNIIIAEAESGEVLLINNSGFGDYGRQQDLDRGKQLQMIDLNVRAIVDLTSRLLPQMLKRGGCVVNVASTAGFQPTAYLATYGATKAFVLIGRWHWARICEAQRCGRWRCVLGRHARISLNLQVLRLRRCSKGQV